MWKDEHRWSGLGIDPRILKEGLAVMVPVGLAAIEAPAPFIAYATVIGPDDREDVWWLNVHNGTDVPLAQMYHAAQILGIPALGLTPTPVVTTTTTIAS